MSDLPDLAYVRPRHLGAARAALARPGAHVYAGGTDLLVALHERRPWALRVRTLVDVKALAPARGIVARGNTVRIGALVTAAELAASPLVRRAAPVLAEAARLTSSPALRRRGTVGGNLATPHPAGDVTTALLALDATAELWDGDRRRRVPLVALLAEKVWPRRRLVLALTFRACPRSAFAKLGARSAFSRAQVAVALAVRGRDVAVALGGLRARPFRAAAAAAAFRDPASSTLRRSGAIAPALAVDCGDVDRQCLGLAATLLARAHRRVTA